MRRRHLIPLLVVPLLVSCSGSASNDNASSSSAKSGSGALSRPLATAAPSAVPRAVVRKATISVTVKNPRAAADDAAALAVSLAGRVDSDRRTDDGDGSAVLVLRVPPAQVERLLAGMAELGKETRRDVADTDVTTTVVDQVSRIATQRASVERVRALLDRAESLSDITKIESELTRRQADLESLLAQQKALSGQVQLASVTATLTGSKATVATASDDATFLDGLAGGWHALVGTARVIAVVLGALLPFAWIPLLALGLRVAWRRRRAAAV